METTGDNDENGLWDGLLVLSNSMYSEVGKSAGEERHQIKEIMLAPETKGKQYALMFFGHIHFLDYVS